MGDTGLEPVTPSLSSKGATVLNPDSKELAAMHSAVCTSVCTNDDANDEAILASDHVLANDLAMVIAAWPTLAEPIRAGMLAMVRASAANQR
jgi:hypothetical protein